MPARPEQCVPANDVPGGPSTITLKYLKLSAKGEAEIPSIGSLMSRSVSCSTSGVYIIDYHESIHSAPAYAERQGAFVRLPLRRVCGEVDVKLANLEWETEATRTNFLNSLR